VSRRQRQRPVSLFLWVVLLATAVWVVTGRTAEPAAAQSDAGASLYATKCASCHQPGGVGVVGTFPPLRANSNAADADYVAEVILNGRIGDVEVDGLTYTTPMPPVLGLSDADVDALVSYVVDLAGQEAASAPPPSTEAPAEPPNADLGHDLFIGSDRFANGGAACSSCHTAGSVGNLGGASLGPDLTSVFETLGGDIGLQAWLSNPPSATMTPLFAEKPLTGEELGHLVAFLAETPEQSSPGGADRLLWFGLAGTAVLLLGMAVAWRGMRQTYVSRLRSRS